MSRGSFREHVQAALDSLPEEFAGALENVAVVVEEQNADDPDLFGLYQGVPLTERGHEAPLLPARIEIYRRPLEEEFADAAELQREIRVTVLLELAHHLGLDEQRLDDLGYA